MRPNKFYDDLPALEPSPGDIWSGLPTHGLLPERRTRGIVITPSCDLAQGKSETITYLPIITVRQWFATRGFASRMRRAVEKSFRHLGVSSHLTWDYSMPLGADLEKLELEIHEKLAQRSSKGDSLHIERCKAACKLLRVMTGDGQPQPSLDLPRSILGDSSFSALLRSILTNAKADTHFLPLHSKEEWGAIQSPSVALFRYPLTVPAEVLSWAQRQTSGDWPTACQALEQTQPFVRRFRGERPMKLARLKLPYLADLLTRYAGMYLRIGSPDLLPREIDAELKAIDGGDA